MNDEKLDLILTKLAAIETGQQEMKGDIAEIKQSQTTMLKRLDDIEGKSDVIIEQVVKNAENITTIKDKQQNITEIIERQENAVDILARRSIDQEAEIKRIK